jgi:hypothetical protein
MFLLPHSPILYAHSFQRGLSFRMIEWAKNISVRNIACMLVRTTECLHVGTNLVELEHILSPNPQQTVRCMQHEASQTKGPDLS